MSRLPRARATDFGPALNSLVTSIQQTTSALGALGQGAGQLSAALHSFLQLANSLGQVAQTLGRQVQGVARPSAALATAGAAAGAAAGGSEGPLSAVIRSLGNVSAAAAAAGVSLTALAASAVPGGFAVLGEVFSYLVATVGQALVPAFVVLLAGVLTVADALATALKPSSDTVRGTFDLMIDTMVTVVKGMLNLWDTMRLWATWLEEERRKAVNKTAQELTDTGVAGRLVRHEFAGEKGPLGQAARQIPEPGEVNKTLGEDAAREDAGRGAENRKRMGEIADSIANRNKPGFAEGLRNDITGNLRSVLQALRQAQGEKGGNVGYAGIGQIREQIQLQSYQSDIQQKRLDVMNKMLDLLEKYLPALKDEKPAQGANR